MIGKETFGACPVEGGAIVPLLISEVDVKLAGA